MKLIDLLRAGRESSFPDAKRILNRVINRKKKIVALSIFSALFAVAIGVAAIYMAHFPSNESEEQIVVGGAMNIIESIESKDGSMVNFPIQSSLQVKTTEDVSAKELKARIAINPKADFSVKKMGECRYGISFQNLSENTLYNIEAVYNGAVVYRWALQTYTPFGVVGASPAEDEKASIDSSVEITFSHGDVSGFEEAFTISPKVEGTFEHYGRVWGFIPSSPLQQSTLYTVTLAPTLKGPDGAELGKEFTFTFKTEDGSSYAYMLYQKEDVSDTFLVNEQPIAAIAYDNLEISSAKVSVYSLDDSEHYIEAYKKYVLSGTVSNKIMDLAERKHIEFESTPIIIDDYNGLPHGAFIHYPEALPQGYYFAQIELGGKTLYQLLQSTYLSVYTLSANGDHVVWVNDGKNGTPMQGIQIDLEGFSKTKTSSTGVAVLKKTSNSLDRRFLIVENGDFPYIAVLNGDSTDSKLQMQSNYYTYLTTDSALYRSGEKIGVFGAVLPRGNGIEKAKNLSLKADFSDEPISLKLDQNGAFTAQFDLPAKAKSNGEITLMMDSIPIDCARFSIQRQEAAPYNLNLSTDKKAYKVGEMVRFDAQLTYLDGTPAAGISLSNGDGIVGITDENGIFNGEIEASFNEKAGNYDVGRFFLKAENTEIYADTAYLVFASDYILESEYKDGKLKISLFEADFTAIEELSEDVLLRETFDSSFFKGAPVSAEIVAEIHELSYIKDASGESYDAIKMMAETAYSYKEKDSILRTDVLHCENGTALFELIEKSDISKNYYVNLSVSGNDHILNRIYLAEEQYFDGSDMRSYDIYTNQSKYSVDEKVVLRIRDTRNNELVNGGSVVYGVVSGGIMDVYQSDSSLVSFDFKKEYGPQVAIYGAYFDGKHIYSLGREYLAYNHKDSLLSIDIESEQDQYQNGEEIALHLKVTDKNGDPVEATLNLSLMDRRLYLTNYNATDPTNDFYGLSEYYDLAYMSESYRDFRRNESEYLYEGEDGFSILNCNYEPSPYFETITTDSRGEATISFKIPDGTTQWKLVARAVSSDAKGGIFFYDLPINHGFYVDAAVPADLKNDQECIIALNGKGSYLAEDSICHFKVGITDRDGNEIKTLETTSPKDSYGYLNFGKLPSGLYTVYIQSNSGNFSHSVIKSFEIAEAGVYKQMQGFYTADGSDLSLNPAKGEVTLTIADEKNSFWAEALAQLINSNGKRVDQTIASGFTQQMQSLGSWGDPENADQSLIASFMDMGGVKLNIGDDHSDLRLSAMVAAVAPSFCDSQSMERYFEQYLNNRYASSCDRIIAYFGLSALGKPVMGDLQDLYKKDSDYSLEEWLYLALGFAYGGDYTTAEYIVDQHVKKHIIGSDDSQYLAVDGEAKDSLAGTFAILASRISYENGENFIRYIIENDHDNPLLNLSLIAYLNDYVPDVVGENKITILTADGKAETYSYQKHRPFILNLKKEEAARIRISNIEGNSVIHYSFCGSSD